MQQIYRRTPMQLYWNRTSTWVFSLNLLHIFRTLFLRTPLNGCFWNKYKQKMQDLEKLHITVNAIRSIVADIVLQQLEQFECLMFGGFHIAKAFYIILANFKKKCLFDALIATGIFSVKTAEDVAGGSHYARSFHGMLILSEALLKLTHLFPMHPFSTP